MDRQDWQNLTAGIVVVAILVGCYWLMREMKRGGDLENCLARRQKNCEQFSR